MLNVLIERCRELENVVNGFVGADREHTDNVTALGFFAQRGLLVLLVQVQYALDNLHIVVANVEGRLTGVLYCC